MLSSSREFFHYGLCIMIGLIFSYIVHVLLNGEMFSTLNIPDLYKWGAIALNGAFGFVFAYRKAKSSGHLGGSS
jgi:hypothetical protein